MKDRGHLVIDGCAVLVDVFSLRRRRHFRAALLRRTSCLAGHRASPVYSRGTPPLLVND